MPVVKVITGIRRCGKSTLLMLYADWLKKNGVVSKQIISINLESARYDNVKDYKTLYDEVVSRIRKLRCNYTTFFYTSKHPH